MENRANLRPEDVEFNLKDMEDGRGRRAETQVLKKKVSSIEYKVELEDKDPSCKKDSGNFGL